MGYLKDRRFKIATTYHLKIFLLIVLILPFGSAYGAYTSADCSKCHSEGSDGSGLHVSIEEFRLSVHGEELACQDCHAEVQSEEHTKRTLPGKIECNQCHKQENRHGFKAPVERRPKCYNCHTKHNIHPKSNTASSVSSGRLKETCKGCHFSECGNTGYFAWFPSIRIPSHVKDDFSQQYQTGNCLGCHQGKAAHGEEKPINDQHCYVCHFDSQGQDLLLGNIHVKVGKEHPSTFVAGIVYQLFIIALLWGGFRFYKRKFSRRIRRC
jgi:hypothetical protein